jgi:hypothetical protein
MTTMGLEEDDQKEEEGEVSAPITVTLKLETSPSLSVDFKQDTNVVVVQINLPRLTTSITWQNCGCSCTHSCFHSYTRVVQNTSMLVFQLTAAATEAEKKPPKQQFEGSKHSNESGCIDL